MAGDDENAGDGNLGGATPNTNAVNRCKAKPREYKEGDNFNQYLNHFERIANANGWSDDIKLVQLETVLKGKAQREFEVFIEETPEITWDEMVDNLKAELVPSAQKSLDEFSRIRMGEMSPREFYAALVRLSKLAHGKIQEKARHVIVRAQLLQAIPKKLRTDAGKQEYLADLEKDDLLEILTRIYDAELREEARDDVYEPVISQVRPFKGDNVSRLNELEKENEKLKSDVSDIKNMVAELCNSMKSENSLGAIGRPSTRGRNQNRDRNRGNFNNLSNVKCFNCQQYGHFAQSCTKQKVCPNCEEKGHGFSACPLNPKNL